MDKNHRTFKVDSPRMEGEDVMGWQLDVKDEFGRMGIECPIVIDGIYGLATRNYTASLCTALGMIASDVMANGVTPELRIRIRNRRLTADERARFDNRQDYRRALRARYESAAIVDVHRMYTKVNEAGWGFKPGVHDGIDVQTPPNAWIFAPVRCEVIDVRSSGWWGKSPSGDVSLGDGIVQVKILKTVGPFLKDYHIGFGHSEHAVVKKGQILDPGDKIARVGLAVVWHNHLMYNNGSSMKGVGNVDPRRILDYAQLHG